MLKLGYPAALSPTSNPQNKMTPHRFIFIACFLALTGIASAADRVWTGAAGDGSFTNTLNWSGATLPANNDYGDTAVFGSAATPSTVTLSAARNIHGLTFSTAGWTVGGANFSTLTRLTSAGVGTNTINQSFELRYDNAAWSVSSGNTLVLANSFYQRSNSVNLTGGGTVIIATAITGYTGTTGSWGLKINDGTTVRFNSATLYYNAAGAVFLNDANARLQIQTSVSAAQLMIGDRVRDGVGAGLQVMDIGGGYIEITSLAAVPEPSSVAALLGLCALGSAGLRRRRRVATPVL